MRRSSIVASSAILMLTFVAGSTYVLGYVLAALGSIPILVTRVGFITSVMLRNDLNVSIVFTARTFR